MSRTRAILAKELLELGRDPKAVLLAFVLPILIYPATFSLTTWLERDRELESSQASFRVAVTGPAPEVRAAIARAEGLAPAAGGEEEQLRLRLRERALDVWIAAPEGSGEDGVPELRMLYHGPNDNSQAAVERVRAVLEEARLAERDRRFREAGGEGSPAAGLGVREVDVATSAEAGGAEAGRTIPFLVIFTLFIGGATLAVDVVAGEKERGTLETLYLAPVERARIAGAKYLLVTAATVLTGVLNLASLLFCYRAGLIGTGESGLVIAPGSLLPCFVLVVPLAALIAGLLLGISAFARSLKEAQLSVLPAMLVAFVPGLLSMTQDVRLGAFTALLPVANVTIALRDALRGDLSFPLLVLVSAASVGWGALALRWTAGVLSREDTILGFSPEPLFSRTAPGRRRAAMAALAGTVLAYFYGGQLLQAGDLSSGVAWSLWVLLPALGAASLAFAWAGGSVWEVLSLRRASARALLGAALLGLGAFVPMWDGVLAVQSRFLPAPESLWELFDESLGQMGLPLLLFLVALSPAIVEELVFRGVFLGLLRRTGSTRSAILISAAFFAVIHLSVFRLLPTFLLGLALATLVVRTRSLFPAMIFHAAYNGISVGIGYSLDPEAVANPAGWVASLALLGAGWALVRQSPSISRPSPPT